MDIEDKDSIKIDIVCDCCRYHFSEINNHILSKIKCNNCLFVVRDSLKQKEKQILQLLENIEFLIYNAETYMRNMAIAEYSSTKNK